MSQTTFQPCPEPGASLFVAGPRIDRLWSGDSRYSADLWLRRPSGNSLLLHEISYSSSAAIALTGIEGTPALASVLLPAMRLGLPLEVEAAVSSEFLEATDRLQEVFSTWMEGFRRIEITSPADTIPLPSRSPGRGVASFFSCGVDSFHTLRRNMDRITHLVFIHGFDMRGDRIQHRIAVEDEVRRIADEFGRELVVIQTNIRDFSDPYVGWGDYGGSVLGASAQLLSGVAETTLVAASNTYSDFHPMGSNPLTDHLFSTETNKVVHDGAEASRFEKILQITEWEFALRHLRVCWRSEGSFHNCGDCDKCVRTMTALFLIGALDRAPTFPTVLDPEKIEQRNWKLPHLWFVHENLERARERGLEDSPVIRALERSLGRMARRLLSARGRRSKFATSEWRNLAAAVERHLHASIRSALPSRGARF